MEQLRNIGRIYRTVQRLDGFVSADFAASGGELLTPLLKFSGTNLRLNLNAWKGSGRVEIQDVDGVPIPGFEMASCQRIKADSIDHLVHWKRNSDLSALAGKPIRLRFEMSGAKLYAFQFANS